NRTARFNCGVSGACCAASSKIFNVSRFMVVSVKQTELAAIKQLILNPPLHRIQPLPRAAQILQRNLFHPRRQHRRATLRLDQPGLAMKQIKLRIIENLERRRIHAQSSFFGFAASISAWISANNCSPPPPRTPPPKPAKRRYSPNLILPNQPFRWHAWIKLAAFLALTLAASAIFGAVIGSGIVSTSATTLIISAPRFEGLHPRKFNPRPPPAGFGSATFACLLLVGRASARAAEGIAAPTWATSSNERNASASRCKKPIFNSISSIVRAMCGFIMFKGCCGDCDRRHCCSIVHQLAPSRINHQPRLGRVHLK